MLGFGTIYIRDLTVVTIVMGCNRHVAQLLVWGWGWGWGWGVINHFLPFRYFPNFPHCQNTVYLVNITSISGRFRYSSPSVTTVKYTMVSKNLIYIFVKSKNSLREKMTNGNLLTSTPEQGALKSTE